MGSCDLPETDPYKMSGDCSLDQYGRPIVTQPVIQDSCTTNASGVSCPTVSSCSPWDITESSDSCFNDTVMQELVNISGAVINVHKLLGVYEQGMLTDTTGNGEPISGGDIPNFYAQNAFDKYITEWRSSQFGDNVVAKSYIGYDFGNIKLANGREQYGIETSVKRDISTIKIKQGCDSKNRVTKIRLERSIDNIKWYGVSVVDIPDCSDLITLTFRRTAPSRFWRIRPLVFNGSSQDYWSVQALELIDYEFTEVTNIQDRIFLENRDRAYDKSPIRVKGTYTPPDVQTFQSKFGMSSLFGGSEQYVIEVSFSTIIAALGRPLVIGDMIQLPSETQYTVNLKPILQWLEITNVSWSPNGYTANWKPTLLKIIAQPAIASQETQDIFGKLTPDIDSSGLLDIQDGSTERAYQDIHNISNTIIADANTQVPENGKDYSKIAKLTDEAYKWSEQYTGLDLRKIDRVKARAFGQDGMPPNGLPFTESESFPLNPANGDYHRLTYYGNNKHIPTALYRYSTAKAKWIFMENDMNKLHNNTTQLLEEYKSDPDAVDSRDIDNNL